jgi:hypothetical protein
VDFEHRACPVFAAVQAADELGIGWCSITARRPALRVRLIHLAPKIAEDESAESMKEQAWKRSRTLLRRGPAELQYSRPPWYGGVLIANAATAGDMNADGGTRVRNFAGGVPCDLRVSYAVVAAAWC